MTFFELSDQATPMRGPRLSLTGGGAKNFLPARTTLLKWGSARNASGMQGAARATLQRGGMVSAPLIQKIEGIPQPSIERLRLSQIVITKAKSQHHVTIHLPLVLRVGGPGSILELNRSAVKRW